MKNLKRAYSTWIQTADFTDMVLMWLTALFLGLAGILTAVVLVLMVRGVGA